MSISALRQEAASRYDDISFRYHRNLSATPQQHAEEVRDAFQTLRLDECGDPLGEKLAAAVKGIHREWAGDSHKRVEQLYGAALRVAGATLGGPVGAALESVKDGQVLGELEHLGAAAGQASKPLLDLLVPDSWGQSSNPSHWALGQQANLMREGRGDLNSQIGWVRDHKLGQPITAGDIEGTLRQQEDFTQRFAAAGYREMTGIGPWEIEGRQVALLVPHDGELKELTGTVTGASHGLSVFQLTEHPDVELSSNDVSVMMVRSDRPPFTPRRW